MAISAIVAVGDVARPAGAKARASARARVTIGPGDDADVEMGPVDHRAPRATASRARSTAACEEGATLVVDGRDPAVAGHENGFFVGADAVRPREARDGDLPRRDLRPGARRVVRVESLDDAIALVNAQSVRERHRAVHALGPRGAPVPGGHRGRHGRHQRADPGADGVLSRSAAGATRCSATCTCTAWTACASTRAARR